jgi:C-terminal domain 7 of the ABC-three component (ABC-3C) systems
VPRNDPRLDQLDTADRLFVSQLQLIAIGNEAFDLAIRDYKRAYLQRSLWLKDELLPAADLARYEDTLIDEWEHSRAEAHASVGNGDEALEEAGRDLYSRIQRVQIAIHDSRKEAFICRGSYHMLADELRVGWHPEFVARLREVLA